MSMIVSVLMSVLMVVLMVVCMDYVAMIMSVTFLTGTSEEPSDLMGSKIRYYLKTFLELICYTFDMMSLHDRKHDFAVDGKRHIYFRSLHHCRPMLVADSMSKFYGYANNCLGVFVGKTRHVDDEHWA